MIKPNDNIKWQKNGPQKIGWFFTWNNYPREAVKVLLEFCKGNCKEWGFQKEMGKSNKTPHLQGYFLLNKTNRPSNFAKEWINLIDWKWSDIWWEGLKSKAHARVYCTKEDTRYGTKFWVYPETVDPPTTPKGKVIGLKPNGNKPKLLTRKGPTVITDLRPFQHTIISMCQEVPDDRTINWVYDQKGRAGKTKLGKYMRVKHGACCFKSGATKDIMQTLRNFILDKDGDLTVDLDEQKTPMLFNIPRCTEHIAYNAIEQIKDGDVAFTKYDSDSMIFDSPHVWIMSNTLPDFEKMSDDRWIIWCIDDDYELIRWKESHVNLGFAIGDESSEEKEVIRRAIGLKKIVPWG